MHAGQVLFASLMLWLLVLRRPNLCHRSPLVLVVWTFGSTAVMVAAAWVLYVRLTGERDRPRVGFIADARGVRVAQKLFGFSLVPFGLAHFMYLEATTSLIPVWLPWHVALAYGTGAAFIAMGLSAAIGVFGRVAATLATMHLSLFGLIVCVPRVLAGTVSEFQWGEFVVTCALTAGAWVVAESFEGAAWFAARERQRLPLPSTPPPNEDLHMRRSALRFLLLAIPLGGAACGAAEKRETSGSWDAAMQAELMRRLGDDQAVRDSLVAAVRTRGALDPTIVMAMAAVDSANTAWMRSAVERLGWPDRDVVGDNAAEAAFLLVQHADLDTAFQALMLPAITAAYERGQAEGQSVALLTDRLAAARGEPQVYGTQTDLRDGRIVVKPTIDSARIDERRARMGLPPMQEYLRVLDSVYLGKRTP